MNGYDQITKGDVVFAFFFLIVGGFIGYNMGTDYTRQLNKCAADNNVYKCEQVITYIPVKS